MKRNKAGERTCIACRKTFRQEDLHRIRLYEGVLHVDSDGRGKGRSVYICQNPVCLETTFRRNKLSAAFRTPIPKEEQDRLREELTDQ